MQNNISTCNQYKQLLIRYCTSFFLIYFFCTKPLELVYLLHLQLYHISSAQWPNVASSCCIGGGSSRSCSIVRVFISCLISLADGKLLEATDYFYLHHQESLTAWHRSWHVVGDQFIFADWTHPNHPPWLSRAGLYLWIQILWLWNSQSSSHPLWLSS